MPLVDCTFRLALDFWEWAIAPGLDTPLTSQVIRAGNYSNKKIFQVIK